MTLYQYSAREIKSRPGRALLTLASVVIGVAAVVAVGLSTRTTSGAYQEMYQTLAGRAAVEIASESGGGFDPALVDFLAERPDVEAVVPILQRPTIIYAGGEEELGNENLSNENSGDEKKSGGNVGGGRQRMKVLAMGIDPSRDRAVREYEVVEGEFFYDDELDDNIALLEVGFAHNLGIQVGDEVRILTRGGLKYIEIVGLLAAEGAAAFRQGVMFLPLPAAQRLFRARGEVDLVHVVPRDFDQGDTLLAEIANNLPAGLIARKPSARGQLSEEMLFSTQQGLQLASALSVMVATFIILNTFLMNVSERRRQLSILRAIGATRSQIQGLLLGEGLLLGLIGTVIGAGVGIGGAFLLTRTMERLFQTSLPALKITPLPFGLGAAIGLGVSLLATYVPAVRASRVSPLEGMRPVTQQDIEGLSPWIARLGWALLSIAGGMAVASYNGWWEQGAPTAVGIIGMLGCVMLVPAALEPLSRFVTVLLRPLLRIEGELAERQLLRRRVRTALTTGVLFVVIGMGTGLGTTIVNNVSDVGSWYDRTVTGDFLLRAMMPDMATGMSVDVPEELRPELEAIPGVRGVTAARFVSIEAAGKGAILIVREFPPEEPLALDLREGEPEQVRQCLLAGDVVIGTVLAKRTDLGVGDMIELSQPEDKREFRICATANEYLVGGLALYMERKVARDKLGIDGVDGFAIRVHDSLDAAGVAHVEAELQTIAQREGLLLQSNAELRAVIDGMVNGVVGGLWALLALAFVVAGFGIVNTLTMNVLEQTRELGLLRIVAMTRGQIRKLILSQAAIMGLIGLGPGAIVGAAIAFLVSSSGQGEFGRSIKFSLHPALFVGAFVGAYLIVIIAAWLPARRAAQLPLAEALHYE